jgi:predicted nucleic acid-binding protein
MKPGGSALKLFLDTNVLYDYFAGRDPFFANAERLVIMKIFGDAELITSSQSYADIFYSLKKHRDSALIQNAFNDSLGVFSICSLDADDIKAACEMGWQDFEDALIAVSAKKVGADYLVTRDRSFEQSPVQVRSPSEIIQMMSDRGFSYAPVNLQEVDIE